MGGRGGSHRDTGQVRDGRGDGTATSGVATTTPSGVP
eukprot:COSAG01_NODE_39417_length_476_cov_38.291777_1_plen_36_part_01